MPRPNRSGRGHRARPRLEALEPRALLATFTVTDLGDSGPGTLRNAIQQANLDAGQDVIAFAPGLAGVITLESALPDLTASAVIIGPGSSRLMVTRDPSAPTNQGAGFRIFTVDSGATVGINDLTVAGGGGVYGGGIANAGTLIVARCAIVGNTLTNGGSIGDVFGPHAGGGIYNSGTLGVIDSLVAGNLAPNFGGIGETQELFPRTGGGGIANVGTAVVVGTTIAANTAAFGGGLSNTGTLTLLNSTVGGNRALGLGVVPIGPGGRLSFGGIPGGGISNSGGGTTTAIFTTITGNVTTTNLPMTPNAYGGGVANTTAPFDPRPSRVVLVDTIVAGNFRGSSQPSDYAGDLPPEGVANLIGVQTDTSGNRTGGPRRPPDPRLGPLANNGGPTPTFALRPGSPAIDRGIALPGVATDQRGARRPQGRAPDIGAFES
jgi:hypothetical protein